MGGLALKNCYTKRITRDEFDIISKLVIDKLATIFTYTSIPKFFRDKETFGDIDIICSNDNLNIDLKSWIKENFDSKEIFHNTNVWSIEFMEVQIDIIIMKEENFNSCVEYMGFNDLGNLVGRYAHRFGLKYGFDGLVFVYRTEGKVLGEIQVSKDIERTINFLGLDYNVYKDGFNTLEDIFTFIVNGKYFDPYMYDMNNLNRINRERNEKRKTYQSFLEYVEPLKDTVKPYVYNKNKSLYIGLIDRYFPGFMEQYIGLEKKEQRRLEIHNKFNGNIVMQYWPNLSGKELGNAITNFKSSFNSIEEYEEFILNNDSNNIFDSFAENNNLFKLLSYNFS